MTMENKKNVPAIRFKGFTDIWIKRSFGEVGSVAMNRRIFKDQTSPDGEIPFYKIGTFGEKPDSYISRKLFEEYKQKYPYPQIGDILISASGSIGRLVEYKGADEYFQDSNIVWLTHDEQLSNLFLKYLYSIIKWNGLEGSTIKRLYNKNLLDTTFMIPNLECHSKSIEEQKAIGNYFQNIDNLIIASQKKLDKLKTIKKACLEKMFPRNGSNIPEIRFKGFIGKWREKSFAEVAKVKRGLTYTPTNIRNEGVRVLRSSNINEDTFVISKDDVFVAKDAVNITYAKDKDILITSANGSSRLVGKHTIISGIVNKSTVHGGFMLLATATEPYFVNASMSSSWYQKFINLYVAGGNGAIGNLNKSDLEKQLISVPISEEQKAVGRFFKKLDKLTALTEQKIEKLKNIKRACLDKMFVNRED